MFLCVYAAETSTHENIHVKSFRTDVCELRLNSEIMLDKILFIKMQLDNRMLKQNINIRRSDETGNVNFNIPLSFLLSTVYLLSLKVKYLHI